LIGGAYQVLVYVVLLLSQARIFAPQSLVFLEGAHKLPFEQVQVSLVVGHDFLQVEGGGEEFGSLE
jgi:hypothetical protein